MSTGEDVKSFLSHNTPITTALLLVLCAGAFWTGKTTESLNTKVENIEVRIDNHKEENKAFQKETINVLQNISKEIRENTYGIKANENNVNNLKEKQ